MPNSFIGVAKIFLFQVYQTVKDNVLSHHILEWDIYDIYVPFV